MKKILIVNGPNLNLLGNREKKFYGDTTLENIKNLCDQHCEKNGMVCSFFQSNHEGEIVDKIQSSVSSINGILINAGAFTHTSISIRDALIGSKIPFVELHISNIFSREEFRKESFLTDKAIGIISGFGITSYFLALEGIIEFLSSNK